VGGSSSFATVVVQQVLCLEAHGTGMAHGSKNKDHALSGPTHVSLVMLQAAHLVLLHISLPLHQQHPARRHQVGHILERYLRGGPASVA
jgi:hypothetical protein